MKPERHEFLAKGDYIGTKLARTPIPDPPIIEPIKIKSPKAFQYRGLSLEG